MPDERERKSGLTRSLGDEEFRTLLTDAKTIAEDIAWEQSETDPATAVFRVEVGSDAGWAFSFTAEATKKTVPSHKL